MDAAPGTSRDTPGARKPARPRDRGKDSRSPDHSHKKEDARDSSQGSPQTSQAALLQQGAANSLQAAHTAPVIPPDTPNLPPTATAAGQQPGNGSIAITASLPTVRTQPGDGDRVASVATPNSRPVLADPMAGDDLAALSTTPASASPAQLQQPTGSKTSTGSMFALQTATEIAPNSAATGHPASATGAANPHSSAVAAGEAQAPNQSGSDTPPVAAFRASFEEIPARTAADADAGPASSGDAEDNAITPAGAQAATHLAASGTRSTHAAAAFDRIVADLAASRPTMAPVSGQGGLPGSTSGQAGDETSSATAAQDTKHHATAPGHDGKSADQSPTPSPIQDPTQNQASPPAGSQNPSAAQAGATAHVSANATAHAGNAAAPIVTTHHPASGSSAFAGTQIGEAGSAAMQAPAPAVNSARLIRRIGEAEIRVGMRSSDFGDVSISTLATHNSISAQISLDHADLAKAIAAHLPEVQARLGASQPVDVRISPTPIANGQLGTLSGGAQQNAGQGQAYSRGQQNYARAPDVTARGPDTFRPLAAVTVEEIGFGRGRLDVRA